MYNKQTLRHTTEATLGEEFHSVSTIRQVSYINYLVSDYEIYGVLKVMTMSAATFWDVTPCSPNIKSQPFQRNVMLALLVDTFVYTSNPKMETVLSN
jgi:hypothetical protein